jgi:hypothetical protein
MHSPMQANATMARAITFKCSRGNLFDFIYVVQRRYGTLVALKPSTHHLLSVKLRQTLPRCQMPLMAHSGRAVLLRSCPLSGVKQPRL